jgi:hypothetical protein
MRRQLTLDYAAEVKLPINPVSRHRVVKNMLHDPVNVGEGTEIRIHNSGKKSYMNIDQEFVGSGTPLTPLEGRFLGRRTLTRVAREMKQSEEIGGLVTQLLTTRQGDN